MFEISLAQRIPQPTESALEQPDFVQRVRGLASQLLLQAESKNISVRELLSQPSFVEIDPQRVQSAVMHEAVRVNDILFVAAAIQAIGLDALRITDDRTGLEVWEQIAYSGDELMSELCKVALDTYGSCAEPVENRWGEQFDAIVSAIHPQLGEHLFGEYWTGRGAGNQISLAPHSPTEGGIMPWVRTEHLSLPAEVWLQNRYQQAQDLPNTPPSKLEIQQHVASLMRELINESRHPSGWYTRALVIDNCASRNPDWPAEIGDGLFAGLPIPAGQFMGLAAGRMESELTDPDELLYYFTIPKGTVCPRKLGGLIPRCQTSFPNLVECRIKLPSGVVGAAFFATEEISEGDPLVLDYDYLHPAKYDKFVEFRPEALKQFIEWMVTQEADALMQRCLKGYGICDADLGAREPGKLLTPETVAKRALLTKFVYVMGTPTALAQLFWASPELAAHLESRFLAHYKATLGKEAGSVFGGPGSTVVRWATELSPMQREALAKESYRIAAQYSGGTLNLLLNTLGDDNELGELLRTLFSRTAIPLSARDRASIDQIAQSFEKQRQILHTAAYTNKQSQASSSAS